MSFDGDSLFYFDIPSNSIGRKNINNNSDKELSSLSLPGSLVVDPQERFVIYENASDDSIYIKNINEDGVGRVFVGGVSSSPKLTIDGNSILYRRRESGIFNIYKKDINDLSPGPGDLVSATNSALFAVYP